MLVDKVSSVRLLLEAADDRLLKAPAHEGAPQKSMEERTAALSELGRLRIPTITGIRIGIGEHPDSWALAAQRITGIHRRYRHIQQMVLVPFEPVPYSTMSVCARPSPDTIREATEIVRRMLDPSIALNVEACDRPGEAGNYLPAGSTDIGCVRLGSTDHVAIDAPQAICELKERLAVADHQLEQRLPWPGTFLEAAVLPKVQQSQIELFRNSPAKFTLPITDLTPPSNMAINLPH
jgi:2-iminoacetate synthase ThiH